jgi:hypothetical protein
MYEKDEEDICEKKMDEIMYINENEGKLRMEK